GTGRLPPPPPMSSGRGPSAATIEAAINAALLPIASDPKAPETFQGVTWEMLELIIRTAIINAGGVPLSSTFFRQFAGWGRGVVWGFGGLVDTTTVGPARLQTVIKRAAAAGAAIPPSGIPLPQVTESEASQSAILDSSGRLDKPWFDQWVGLETQ